MCPAPWPCASNLVAKTRLPHRRNVYCPTTGEKTNFHQCVFRFIIRCSCVDSYVLFVVRWFVCLACLFWSVSAVSDSSSRRVFRFTCCMPVWPESSSDLPPPILVNAVSTTHRSGTSRFKHSKRLKHTTYQLSKCQTCFNKNSIFECAWYRIFELSVCVCVLIVTFEMF